MPTTPPGALRILLQLPNWLGDVIMTTPLLAFLSDALSTGEPAGQAELHLAVRPAWAPLFAADPRVTSVLPVERRGRHAGAVGIWRQGRDWRRGGFDAVLLGPPSLRAGLVAAVSGISCRAGHAGDGRDWLLRPAVPRGPRGSRHFGYEMLELGLALLAELSVPAPPLAQTGLPHPSLPGCDGIRPATSAGGGEPLLVVAPGTTYGQAKTWPPARVGEFIEMAGARMRARIVLLGDRQTADFVGALRRESPLVWGESLAEPSQVVDLTGRTDLTQVVAVLKAAAAFVGNDSGLMHLAGALGVPTVGIFGSSNPEWTHPLGPRTAAVVAAGFDCRPCYRKTCNQPEFCLETISAGAVLDRVQSLLGIDGGH